MDSGPDICSSRLKVAVRHSGSALVSVNEVNLHQAQLVLRWATVSGSIPGAGHFTPCPKKN